MNLSEKKLLQTSFNVHGRDNQSFPTSLVPKKWLYLATTFSTPALRGLPHSSQNQKQIQITIWWWGEQACLCQLNHPPAALFQYSIFWHEHQNAQKCPWHNKVEPNCPVLKAVIKYDLVLAQHTYRLKELTWFLWNSKEFTNCLVQLDRSALGHSFVNVDDAPRRAGSRPTVTLWSCC